MKERIRKKASGGRAARAAALALLLAILGFSIWVRTVSGSLPSLDSQERLWLQDEDGLPYLSEMDSYFYLRKAEEMAEEDRMIPVNFRSTDALMGPRVQSQENETAIPLGLSVLAWLLWKYMLSGFGVTLRQTAFWMGTVLGSMTAVPAFCYVRKRTCLMGGVAAGILSGCALPFVLHTYAGFFDTDMVLGVLPLTQMLAQFSAMKEKRPGRQFGWALLSAAALSLMSLFWVAYYGYFVLALVCMLCAGVIPVMRPEGKQKGRWTMLRGGLMPLLCSAALLVLLHGKAFPEDLAGAVMAYRSFRVSTDAMPFVFQQTGEMRAPRVFPALSPLEWVKANTKTLVGMLGGMFPCLMGLLAVPAGLLGPVLERKYAGNEKRTDTQQSADIAAETVYLGVWLLITGYLACIGNRFAELAVLPLSVLCGLLVGRLDMTAAKCTRRGLARVLCILLAVCTVGPVCRGAWNTSRAARPFLNDAKSEAMHFIRETLPADTAVAGWWDDGYYTEYAAGRRTLADGGTDSGKINWLMAKALLTEDDGFAGRILRMLSVHGADALDRLEQACGDQAEAADLLIRLLKREREEAASMLSSTGISGEILEYTHPETGSPLVLTLSTDMVAKHGTLAYFAFWNPAARAQEEKTFAVIPDASIALESSRECDMPMRGGEYTLHLSMDAQGRIACTYSGEQGTVTPSRLCVWEQGERIQDEQYGNDHAAVVVVREGKSCSAMLCSANLCDSMLIRLMFCEDAHIPGIRHLGTWYGGDDLDTCAAQRRIEINYIHVWCTQLWQILEPEENETVLSGDGGTEAGGDV